MDIEKILCSPELIQAIENGWTWVVGVTVPFLMIGLRMLFAKVNEQPWPIKRIIMWGISYALPFLGNLIGQPDLSMNDLMIESGVQALFIGSVSELGWNKGLKPALKKYNLYNADPKTNKMTFKKHESTEQQK